METKTKGKQPGRYPELQNNACVQYGAEEAIVDLTSSEGDSSYATISRNISSTR